MRPDFVKLGKRLVRKVYLSPLTNEGDELTADHLYIRPLTVLEELDVQRRADALIEANKQQNHDRWKIRIEQICRLQMACYKNESCKDKFFEGTDVLFQLPEIQINYLADQYDQVEDLANPSSRLLSEIVDPKEKKKELERRLEELKKNSLIGTTLSTVELLDLCLLLGDLWVLEEQRRLSLVANTTNLPTDSGTISDS